MTKKYTIQKSPFVVPTTDGKLIEEHFGKATDQNSDVSIAHMLAPPFWSEPFQTPKFDEYTYIIKGKKQFTIDGEIVVLTAGKASNWKWLFNKVRNNNIDLIDCSLNSNVEKKYLNDPGGHPNRKYNMYYSNCINNYIVKNM